MLVSANCTESSEALPVDVVEYIVASNCTAFAGGLEGMKTENSRSRQRKHLRKHFVFAYHDFFLVFFCQQIVRKWHNMSKLICRLQTKTKTRSADVNSLVQRTFFIVSWFMVAVVMQKYCPLTSNAAYLFISCSVFVPWNLQCRRPRLPLSTKLFLQSAWAAHAWAANRRLCRLYPFFDA